MARLPSLPRWRGLPAIPFSRPSDTALRRVRDLLVRNLPHPAGREEVHARHGRGGGESLVRWRLRRLRALLAGEPPGRPDWLGDGHGDR